MTYRKNAVYPCSKRMDDTSGVSLKSYKSLLTDVARIFEDYQSAGNADWNKCTLVGNWKIGQRIVEVEQNRKDRAGYGDRILKQLSNDLNRRFGQGFSDRNLRYMRKFYQTFSLHHIRPELSWSHYRCLLLVEDGKIRDRLENQAISAGWSHRELLGHIQAQIGDSEKFSSDSAASAGQGSASWRPVLELYTYRMIQNFSPDLERSVPNLDLGFDVRLEGGFGPALKFPIGSILRVRKNRKSFSFERIQSNKSLFSFKAYLEKVVDGDTLLVNIDLGFHVFLRQRLRLRGIDSPELGSKKGANAKKFVEAQLKDCPFLLLKTYGSDKYDRYLADIVYLKKVMDVSLIAKEGLSLNQELIRKGLAILV